MKRFASRFALGLIALLSLTFVTPSSHALWKGTTWVNVSPFKIFTNKGLSFRPRSPSEKNLVIADYNISKTPVNVKGINAGVTPLSNGTAWAYRNITIRHCEISYLSRTAGYHCDFIRIFGGGSSKQDVPTSVLIDDVYVHDGDVLPLLIQDGNYDKVTIRNFRMQKVATSVQLCAMKWGNIDAVYVENSPGISVALSGRPGAIKYVYVKNCPGAKIVDCNNVYGRSGAKIIYQ